MDQSRTRAYGALNVLFSSTRRDCECMHSTSLFCCLVFCFSAALSTHAVPTHEDALPCHGLMGGCRRNATLSLVPALPGLNFGMRKKQMVSKQTMAPAVPVQCAVHPMPPPEFDCSEHFIAQARPRIWDSNSATGSASSGRCYICRCKGNMHSCVSGVC